MAVITSIDQLDMNKIYSYADYLLWKFEERVELFKGKIFKMSPAPAPKHQKVSFNISMKLGILFENQPCEVYYAPFDVRLSRKNEKDEEILTVVQPDLCVICDSSKIDNRGCLGAPDLVIEILSPGNSKKEINNKYDLYEEAGVKEYWVVHPLDQVVYIYILEDGRYRNLKPVVDNFVQSHIFKDLKIHTDDIFREKKF